MLPWLAHACMHTTYTHIWRELHNMQYAPRTTYTATPTALPERTTPTDNKPTTLCTSYKANVDVLLSIVIVSACMCVCDKSQGISS